MKLSEKIEIISELYELISSFQIMILGGSFIAIVLFAFAIEFDICYVILFLYVGIMIYLIYINRKRHEEIKQLLNVSNREFWRWTSLAHRYNYLKLKRKDERMAFIEAASDVSKNYRLDSSYFLKSNDTILGLNSSDNFHDYSTFEREFEMEDYIAERLELLEPGMQLVGRQVRLEVGIIDILAMDRCGDLVVIELKNDVASDKVIGQITRYMGELKKEKLSNVRGIIIAMDFDKKIESSISCIPNIKLVHFLDLFQ